MMPDQLDARVEWQARNTRYHLGRFMAHIVPLDEVYVWPNFGGLSHARGTAKEVAEWLYPRWLDGDPEVVNSKMGQFFALAQEEPQIAKLVIESRFLVAFLTGDHPDHPDYPDGSIVLDDGSHRAVMAAAMETTAHAGVVVAHELRPEYAAVPLGFLEPEPVRAFKGF